MRERVDDVGEKVEGQRLNPAPAIDVVGTKVLVGK